MSNRTEKYAHSVHGLDPQAIVDKIVRRRIYESIYWKEQCFALSGEDVLVKACKLKFYGGHYGSNMLPTPFLCLLLKLLQIQPDIAIIHEFIDNEDFKYLRILGAFYFRLVASAKDIYQKLEPIYSDYRKVKLFNQVKQIELQHIDEIIDQLLRNERFCGITMPNIQKRFILEEFSGLPLRVSKLDEDLKNYEVSSSEDEEKEEK